MRKRWLSLLCVLLCLLPLCAAQALPVTVEYCDSFPRLGLPQPKLEVAFLNMSAAGDSILIRSGGETMLLDSGPHNYLKNEWLNLRHLGVTELDTIFASHYHSDHMENFSLLMYHGLRPTHAYLPNAPARLNPLEMDLFNRLAQYDIPYSYLKDGDVIQVGDAKLTVMRAQGVEGPNLRSAQVLLECGQARVFLTADATGEAQQDLIDRYGDFLRADIFKVAHHGYNRMVPGLYDLVQPGLVVLTNNRTAGATAMGQINDLGLNCLWTTRGNIICQTDGETGWHIYQETKPVWKMTPENAGEGLEYPWEKP